MTNETKSKTKSSAPQNTWEMATAILVALHQAHLKAQAEYQAITEAAPCEPFAPGLLAAGHMIQTLRPALTQLEGDMSGHARSSGLAMPKLEC